MEKIVQFSKLLLFLAVVLPVFLLISTTPIHAATLGNASDTITTSRPSASTPLSANMAIGDGNASVYNNGSTFLASDSAHLWGQTQENVNIGTVSAAKTSLFFTGTAANAHANGTVISTAITAMHTVSFITQTSIPSTGSIVFTFPTSVSTDTNQASPSANTFMFNGLSSTNIKTNNATCGSYVFTTAAGGAFSITCNLSSSIAGGTTVTFLIGCSANTGASCNTQVPTLINPTKTAQAGTADIWTLKLNTYDSNNGTGNPLDNTKVQIGTVESVNVVAHIDPTFTFTISGIPDGTSINTSQYCGTTHAAATSGTGGFPTTSTDVNLGTLTPGAISRAYQTLLILSNAGSGYVVTATSSGHLMNPANAAYINDNQGTPVGNDNPAPSGINTNGFGISACDANGKVDTSKWGAVNNFYANPSQTFYYTLVSSAVQPATGGDKMVIGYSAKPGNNTPAGDYRTQVTYVVSPIF